LKDITYNGHSALFEPLRPGSATGEAGMRVTLAADGGVISAKVADRDGNPLGDSWVIVMPGQVASEAMLASAFVSGQTDQTGAWKSRALAPGKYYVLAKDAPPDKSHDDN